MSYVVLNICSLFTFTWHSHKKKRLIHYIGLYWLPCPVGTEKYNFLGISIVGQSNERGDGGIYIGSIMKGGAVAADGRIEPGDMLLQVRWTGTSWVYHHIYFGFVYCYRQTSVITSVQ